VKKVLFILKRQNTYYPNFGLSGAANLTSQYLNNSVVDYAIDSNDVDRLVVLHNADIVILEAIWTTPEKIDELMSIHPNVQFIVRAHSQIEFLAEEGQVFDWLFRYNCDIAVNHEETAQDLSNILNKEVLYLPNIYPKPQKYCNDFNSDSLNISCFGASRVLKNQFNQAVAAIQYANEVNRMLIFHMNQADTQIMKNIRSLFNNSEHVLIEHTWLPKSDFFNLVSAMDLGMQVSLTETFNLVTADHIWQSVPMVVSNQIDWLGSTIENNYDIDQIKTEINKVMNDKVNVIEQQIYNLILYNFEAKAIWDQFTN